jgi:hypothetical protein
VVQPDGKRCTLTFRENRIPASDQYSLVSGGCFHGSLFGVNRWSLRGREVVIEDAFGRKRHVLRVTGPNVLEGGGLTLTR